MLGTRKIWRGTKRVAKAGLSASCAFGTWAAIEMARENSSPVISLVAVGLGYSSAVLMKSALTPYENKDEDDQLNTQLKVFLSGQRS